MQNLRSLLKQKKKSKTTKIIINSNIKRKKCIYELLKYLVREREMEILSLSFGSIMYINL